MGDRIVENALWVIFADLDLIPVWIPLLVLTRGFIVDGLRSLSYSDGMTPFGENNMMRSVFTEWLTAGRFMRGFFGWAKAAGFVLGELYTKDWYILFGWALVWSAVALTIVRGIPVMIDAVGYFKETNGNPTSSR
jgi:CDP-diacylglycerol--glycerol-3-phosphate 3-phosphatidyltransferase